jgi:hypothetical protein
MRMTRMMTMTPRHETLLVVRASLPRTFRSLGVFTEAALFFCGGYLLLQVMRSPLETGEAAIIAAGLILPLASVLLFYLVRPGLNEGLAQADESAADVRRLEVPLTAYGEAVQARKKAEHALDKDELPGPM